jgi:hypothetical protein
LNQAGTHTARATLITRRIHEQNAGMCTGGHLAAVSEERSREGSFEGDGFTAQLVADTGIDELGSDGSEEGWWNWSSGPELSAEQPGDVVEINKAE